MSHRSSAPPRHPAARLQQVLAAGAETSGFWKRRQEVIHEPAHVPTALLPWQKELNAGLTYEVRNSEMTATNGRRIQWLRRSIEYEGFAFPNRLGEADADEFDDMQMTYGIRIRSPLSHARNQLSMHTSPNLLKHMNCTKEEFIDEVNATYSLTVSPFLPPEYLIAWREVTLEGSGPRSFRIFTFLGSDFEDFQGRGPWQTMKDRTCTLAERLFLGRGWNWPVAQSESVQELLNSDAPLAGR